MRYSLKTLFYVLTVACVLSYVFSQMIVLKGTTLTIHTVTIGHMDHGYGIWYITRDQYVSYASNDTTVCLVKIKD